MRAYVECVRFLVIGFLLLRCGVAAAESKPVTGDEGPGCYWASADLKAVACITSSGGADGMDSDDYFVVYDTTTGSVKSKTQIVSSGNYDEHEDNKIRDGINAANKIRVSEKMDSVIFAAIPAKSFKFTDSKVSALVAGSKYQGNLDPKTFPMDPKCCKWTVFDAYLLATAKTVVLFVRSNCERSPKKNSLCHDETVEVEGVGLGETMHVLVMKGQ